MPAPIILFDGVCHLCQFSVRFIIRRDPKASFSFAALQAQPGRDLIAQYAIPDKLDTLILIENGQWYDKSTAALRICRRLHRLWPVLYGFIILPRPLRDAVYQWIARHRYRWFGRDESCPLPDPGMAERFIS